MKIQVTYKKILLLFVINVFVLKTTFVIKI